MAYPWLTTDDIVAAVQRKISMPISQNTYSYNDISAFANEEMMIGQVPNVMSFHQEYFVETAVIPLQPYISNYHIPERAIGLKLRDIFYIDNANNFVEMTRVNADDRAFFQANIASSNSVYKFYLQGNDIIVTPAIMGSVFGSLLMVYWIRPNQLVANTRAATITGFNKNITLSSITDLSNNDTITFTSGYYQQVYTQTQAVPPYQSNLEEEFGPFAETAPSVIFTGVTGTPTAGQFQIVPGNPAQTAINLSTLINSTPTFENSSGNFISSVNGTVITVYYVSVTTGFTCVTTGTNTITFSQGVLAQVDQIPSNITDGSFIDVNQTEAGHKIRAIDIQLGSNAISGTIIQLPDLMIPIQTVGGNQITPSLPVNQMSIETSVGDTICTQYECIIPQIPTDLHIALVERTCARLLAAIGDQAGLAIANAKVQEVEKAAGTLVDNRTEGNPMKILGRHALLRYGKMGPRRNLS